MSRKIRCKEFLLEPSLHLHCNTQLAIKEKYITQLKTLKLMYNILKWKTN